MARAVTSTAYVVSVNRPEGDDSPAGGASFVVDPDGTVMVETTRPVKVVSLERAAMERARGEYPGYLNVRSDLYSRGWAAIRRES